MNHTGEITSFNDASMTIVIGGQTFQCSKPLYDNIRKHHGIGDSVLATTHRNGMLKSLVRKRL